MYSRETQSASALFDAIAKENRQGLSSSASQAVAAGRMLIDIQCRIASYFVPFWLPSVSPILWKKGRKELRPLLFGTFHRSIFSSYAILRLTSDGLFGPARAILRSIFESLMIAKFSDISENPTVMMKWHNTETIYFTNSVLKKIITPDPQPFVLMWNRLCDLSHATRYAGQFSMLVEDHPGEQMFTLAVLNALLECNYHLLNSLLITPDVSHMVKFCCTRATPKLERSHDIPELRKTAHRQFKENRAFLDSELIGFMAAYKRKWNVKP